MLNLPKYSQRDPAWFDARMGNSPVSLGMDGCTFTSACMAAFAFGKGMSPGEAVKLMNQAGGFDQNGDLNWLILAKVFGLDHGFRWDTDANIAPNHSQVSVADAYRHIDFLTSVGIPPVIWVDTDHDGKPNHWCVYIGDGQIIDPWDGAQVPMSSRYDQLYGYSFFNGTPILLGGAPGKISAFIGKANEISHGRNVAMNANEIMQTINRP